LYPVCICIEFRTPIILSISMNLCLKRCENLRCYHRGSFKFLLKGQRSVPSTHLFPKGAETAQRCYRRRSWGRKRDFVVSPRFRFSCGWKQKERGSLCGWSSICLLLSRGLSSGRAPKTLHGPRSFISNASDTRALFSTCTRRIHQNVRASCTYTRTSLIFSLHGGQVGVTTTCSGRFSERQRCD